MKRLLEAIECLEDSKRRNLPFGKVVLWEMYVGYFALLVRERVITVAIQELEQVQ